MENLQSPKPLALFPDELKQIPHWVAWSLEDGKKVPKNPHTSGNAMVNVPATWGSFEDAIACGLNVGFVLTEDDPYTCVDLDHCLGERLEVDERGRAVLDLLKGYVELSPSETGLHVWVKSELPINRRTPGVEIYSSHRWMSVTGRANPACPNVIPDRTDELQILLDEFFPAQSPSTYEPLPVPESDLEVWSILFRSKSGEVYESLFNGDMSHTRNDHSYSVLFLANMLSLMTNGDARRIKALLYQTGLVSEKWESKRGNRSWIDLQIEDSILWARRRSK